MLINGMASVYYNHLSKLPSYIILYYPLKLTTWVMTFRPLGNIYLAGGYYPVYCIMSDSYITCTLLKYGFRGK